MYLKKANINDFDLIMNILKDGANQLAERGIDQWQGDYPNGQHVKDDISSGYAWLARSDDEKTVGTLAIVPGPDVYYQNLDGKWLVDTDDYLVIHRVAIHSDHAGKGYASKLFETVLDALKEKYPNDKSIRIDTHQDNKVMQHLIEKNGFQRVGKLHGVYQKDEISYVYEQVI